MESDQHKCYALISQQYDVDIMLDTAEYYFDYQYSGVYLDTIDEDHDKSIGVWGCGCTACRKTKNTEGKVKFSGYDRIPLKKSATKQLSDHQCLICPQKILVGSAICRFDRMSNNANRDTRSSRGHGVNTLLP